MPTANIGINEEKRHTRLFIGVSERTLLYRGFLRTRTAQDIKTSTKADGTPSVKSQGVIFLPGNAIGMSPWAGAWVNLTKVDWWDSVIAGADVEAAPHMGEIPLHRDPNDLSGIGSSSAPSGPNGHIRRVPAGANWSDAQLSADLEALPPPGDPDLTIPVDRVIATKITYPPNTGFGILFSLDRDFWGVGTFIRLYFGGPTATTPAGKDAGLFCLAISGSGVMWLYEHDNGQPGDDKWALRQTLKWGSPGRPEYTDTAIGIYPYAWDRIALTAKNTEPFMPKILGALGKFFSRLDSFFSTVYHEDGTDHKHNKEMTGSGIVRVDLRRTARCPIGIVRMKFHEQAVLTDEPFDTERAYPENTPIKIQLNTYLLPNTGVSATVYDATTNAVLDTDSNGNFLSNKDQRFYYVRFVFTSSPDRFNSPILFGYYITINPVFHNISRTPTSAGIITRMSLTCEDEQGADHASGDVENSDLFAQLTILRTQDRIRTNVAVLNDFGTVISYLGEYDTAKSRGKLRGTALASFPNTDWRDFSVKLVGQWSRLVEAMASQLYNFAEDPNAAVDPDTRAVPPWRVVDAMRVLFNDAGIPDDELDLPNSSMRFWLPSTSNAEEWLVQAGQPILPIIEKLARDYLLGVIVRDRNAGPRGMWRHIRRPVPPFSNFLWHFRLERPAGSAGRMQSHAGAWGAGSSWIQKGTFESWPEAPLANVIVVRGVRPGPVKDWLITSPATNQDSIDNPLSVHYLGREIRYVRKVDPGITSKKHCDWMAALLFDELAFRRMWASWVAPLPLVIDPNDSKQLYPRPLRVYDRVLLEGNPFLLTNVDIDVRAGYGSENHFGIYEGYFPYGPGY